MYENHIILNLNITCIYYIQGQGAVTIKTIKIGGILTFWRKKKLKNDIQDVVIEIKIRLSYRMFKKNKKTVLTCQSIIS